ncbi:hypothetical protein [uncultured Azohydromonas sp.]|uniref:hypothetical protein n=1 Tax=uncultured Azohydromonas sp. TaxID=487342 RepID=UPI00263A2452|nr:hypothetical protein [uncultured Azohydromonas sp.]
MGSVLAGCTIEAVLQVGPVCTVYRAGDALGAGRYALKEYCPQALCVRDGDGTPRLHDPDDTAARAAFEAGRGACLEELRLLSRLRLPGLVSVLQANEEQGSLCGLMPLLPGVPLDALPPPRSGDEVRELLLALLEPLAQLHAAGLVHGGLHARQLLWAPGQRPVLLGFGSAARALRLDEVFRGAPPEMRPEGAHLPRGPWTDLYMLAATVLDHLGAWKWTTVPTQDEVAAAIVQALPSPVGPAQRALVPALQACLRASPTERPAGAVALRAMLGDAVPGPQPLRPAAAGAGRGASAEWPQGTPPGSDRLGVLPKPPAPGMSPAASVAGSVPPFATPPPAAASGGRATAQEPPRSPASGQRRVEPAMASAFAAATGAQGNPAASAATASAVPATDPALAAVPDGHAGGAPVAPRGHPAVGWRMAIALLLLAVGAGWAAWWGQGWWEAEQERRHMDRLLAEAAARAQAPASSPAAASRVVPDALGLGVPRSATSQAPVPDGPTAAVPPAGLPAPPMAGGASESVPRAGVVPDIRVTSQEAVPPAPTAPPQPRSRERAAPSVVSRSPTAEPAVRSAELPDAPLSACVVQAKSALERCMRQQCAKPAWRRHVQCERWLESPGAAR